MSRKALSDIAADELRRFNDKYARLPERVPELDDGKISSKRAREWDAYKAALADYNDAVARAAKASSALCLAAKELANTFQDGAVDPIFKRPLDDPTLPAWM